MALRTPAEMKLHDTIVNTIKNIYETKKGATSVQTCNDKIAPSVKGVYPDLIVKAGFTLYFKVETESTVTDGAAISWKQISEKLGTVYLVVPSMLKDEALSIIKSKEIPKVVIITYKIANNKLVFGNLPG